MEIVLFAIRLEAVYEESKRRTGARAALGTSVSFPRTGYEPKDEKVVRLLRFSRIKVFEESSCCINDE